MDPVTVAAVVGALSAGALKGAGEVAQKALTDGYAKLKEVLHRKFGDGALGQAIDGLERSPESKGRQMTLQEEVDASRADEDPEVRRAAQVVLELVAKHADGAHVQNATGQYIAQADRNSSAQVNVGLPAEPRK